MKWKSRALTQQEIDDAARQFEKRYRCKLRGDENFSRMAWLIFRRSLVTTLCCTIGFVVLMLIVAR